MRSLPLSPGQRRWPGGRRPGCGSARGTCGCAASRPAWPAPRPPTAPPATRRTPAAQGRPRGGCKQWWEPGVLESEAGQAPTPPWWAAAAGAAVSLCRSQGQPAARSNRERDRGKHRLTTRVPRDRIRPSGVRTVPSLARPSAGSGGAGLASVRASTSMVCVGGQEGSRQRCVGGRQGCGRSCVGHGWEGVGWAVKAG